MRCQRWVLKVLSLFIAVGTCSAASELTELARAAKPSVVFLSILDAGGKEVGSGTGFFVSDDGRIVTNFHVVEHAVRMEAKLANGHKVAIRGVLAKDEVNDIAILQADAKTHAGQALPLAEVAGGPGIEAGERVFVVGAPRGLAGTLSEGIVAATRQSEDLEKYDAKPRPGRAPLLQITAPISPGSSGSPVLDTRGQTVGVAVSHLGGGQNLNFAVPVSIVRKLLREIPANAVPRPLGGLHAGWNLLFSAAFFGAMFWGGRKLFRRPTPALRGRPTQRY